MKNTHISYGVYVIVNVSLDCEPNVAMDKLTVLILYLFRISWSDL